MASTAATTTPDTQIAVKANHDGSTRRFKLSLRDVGASTLEDKVRSALQIPSSVDCVLERYSDSAATYIVLDSSNTAVYKQLYRAAKAKHKLKLRIMTTAEAPEEAPEQAEEAAQQEKVVPKPATVEDEPEPRVKAVPMAFPPRAIPVAPINTTESPRTDSIEPRLPSELPNTADPKPADSPPTPALPVTNFAVCCNACERTIPRVHYHCNKCDDGDFDLCQECVDSGVSCNDNDHWLIKRLVQNGVIISSTTETLAPKPKKTLACTRADISGDIPSLISSIPVVSHDRIVPIINNYTFNNVRTCNCCVEELPEEEFVHCTACEDYDLCKQCFVRDAHGHHPSHGFVPVVESSTIAHEVSKRLQPGRHQRHNAICDGCDKKIYGIRHKCQECPDWDYCSDCVINASFVHAGHRFAPLYDQLKYPIRSTARRPVHSGICCDGPLCNSSVPSYISGDRFKCAVCHDVDFCANCEASPSNSHNKTHPLIKFKTPVRHVSVTTTGEHGSGRQMPQMGDRIHNRTSRATETTLVNQDIAAAPVQTVVDVQPVTPPAVPKKEPMVETSKTPIPVSAPLARPKQSPFNPLLSAEFMRDTIPDGSVMGANHVFEQTWILKNNGNIAWPAGCSVKFVGGDYMGHVDANHPAGIHELVSASESTKCYAPLAPGQSFPFTVLLRTPPRNGQFISYWRLTSPIGEKFGHRLWCDVQVKMPLQKEEATPVPVELAEVETKEYKAEELQQEVREEPMGSQMIFPKLEKESPVSSIVAENKPVDVVAETEQPEKAEAESDGFEDCEDVEWANEASEDGFLTDEEYDILDASDEEYLEEQLRTLQK